MAAMFARTWLAVSLVVALVACATPPALSPQARGELAPSGKLRAAINYGNPVLARKDGASGELRGVTVDLSRELARRLDVPVELVGYDTVAKLLAGLKAGEWDVAFLAHDPARANEMTFTAPYMEVEVTYLVPEQSAVHDISQIDRPGLRIALQEKNAADLFLARELKHATLVRAGTAGAAFALLKSGSADALAENRQFLATAVASNRGFRILDGRFTTIPHAVAVPAGRRAAASSLDAFVGDVKASGFVQRSIEAQGLRGVVVPRATAAR